MIGPLGLIVRAASSRDRFEVLAVDSCASLDSP